MIWTCGSTSLNCSGVYQNGTALGLATCDGSISNYKQPASSSLKPMGGPPYKLFPADVYKTNNPVPMV